ncbi:MICAL-like protein 1 isoform X2 [Harmonia axyridis]|uniref:MICAL-like protein 1 isoform X2 n=1 Tax=Harmonia axyridis TaxID=115357 RepID=UPI001E274E30|nr:MICAL-like protein 1 isoform X2 [Harmonia axyridis]
MGERRGTRGLELWCKRMTEGYPGVKVENMTTSWRDGLAFCAIIHHFRPDLIDFSKLNKNDIYNNNNLAFRIAEDHLGIPALLEPEDMVEYAVPDRLSILTYLSQFYQVFAVNSSSNTKLPSKRPPPSDLQRHMVAATGSSPPKKAALGVLGARKEPCAKCGLPVFIAERLNVRKTLYHRTCFRCAKCDIQLTLHNYTETESGKFCCKICPEEEKSAEMSVLTRSLSDEEKSASLKGGDSDPYSDNFENVLEDPRDGSLKRSFTLDRMLGTSFVKARSDFMATQMTAFDSDLDTESEEKPPDLPVSPRPQLDDDAQKHSENILSSNSLPNLSDNFSVDQKPCISRDRVTKDSVSTEDLSVKPSIRSRVKLFEAAIKDCAKTDVNSESREENDNSEGVHQVLSPGDESIGGSSLSIDEKVKEDSSPNDSVVTNLEHSKAHSSNLSVSSKISDEVINEEVIILSSETSYQPQSNEDSVIVISDTEDPKCQTSVQTSEAPDRSDLENEQPKSVTEYPDDLNPFGDEEETEHQKQPLPEADRSVSLNPFGDTDEEEEEEEPPNRPLTDSKSLNPFGSDEDEEDDEKCSSLPPQPALRRLAAPKMSLSPFWDEEDVYGKSSFETWEDESGGAIEQSSLPPQPARRKLKAPKISLTPYWDEENSPSQASSTYSSPSLSRADKSSLHGSGRKKKPAPKPPIVSPSPKEPPKSRKTRRAPPPPTSTPMRVSDSSHLPTVSPIGQGTNTEQMQGNRNESDKNQQHNSSPSDSTKRLTATEIDHDLELIEVQLRGLEKNGVQLEKIIREKTEVPGANPDDTLAPEIEDMILQLFELINDKHELFRKQTELMYLRRQNRLEKEQADVENQLRCLMLQSDAHKTDRAKAKEEKLLNKLLEIVEKRNEIVERLDVERRRQAEEDISIRSEMSLYSMKRKGEHSSLKKIKKDKHKSEKEKSSKKNKGGSADKDADDSVKLTPKDKKKKKILNIF